MLQAESSSAWITPEESSRLNSQLEACIPAAVPTDLWMLATTLFYLMTGTKLFPTKTDSSDAIHPDAMKDLVEWTGLSDAQKKSILADCDTASVELERLNAIDLLQTLLARDPDSRPPSIERVLEHPFWKAAGSVESLSAGARRKFVLGYAPPHWSTTLWFSVPLPLFVERCETTVKEMIEECKLRDAMAEEREAEKEERRASLKDAIKSQKITLSNLNKSLKAAAAEAAAAEAAAEEAAATPGDEAAAQAEEAAAAAAEAAAAEDDAEMIAAKAEAELHKLEVMRFAWISDDTGVCNCCEENSIIKCEDCKASFCAVCDDLQHAFPKFASHRRQRLNVASNTANRR